MSIRTCLTAFMAVLSVANGHMIMNTPTPFGVSTLNNSPLVADGSDFPCKQRSGVYDVEAANNVMPIGVTQTLSFNGSAVHGGGSCQLSLTSDKAPTKDTQWQVIHSIIGGCPANVDGNLPADPNGQGASKFQFSIPSGIAPGDYVLAWTWFNKIGNREMYMNCAPVTVTGAKRKRTTEPLVRPWFTKRENFPSMFVANIQGVSNGCGTLENFDVVFPDPGQSVQTVSGSQFTPPVSCANAAATPAASPEAASASAAAPAPTSTSGSGSGSGNESPAATSVPTVAPGVFASGAASASAAVPVATSAAAPSAAAPSAAAPVASAAPSAAAPPTSSGSAGTQSGPCTNEGDWNCIGGTSFQRCASGSWSAAMQMAAGTSCTPGISSELTMAKRALRFAQPHVRRSFNTWGH